MNMLKKTFLLCALSSVLAACSIFDKDNTPTPTPLTRFKTEADVKSLWSTRTGFGIGTDYIKLRPSVNEQSIFVANKDGSVVAIDKTSGSKRWIAYTHLSISAGPTAQDQLVVLGSRKGDVIALNQADGKTLWQVKVASEMLAAPAISHDKIIIKTIDGNVTALATKDGHTLWNYKEIEPTLILRGASAPQINHDAVYVGYANGSITKIGVPTGSLLWKQNIATPEGIFAVQRMVDIDASPVIVGNTLFAAAYQSKIAAMDSLTGKILWSQDVSSYAGLTADAQMLYVSDANSQITAFYNNSGRTAWQQTKLAARNITGPVIVSRYIVVGDAEGYLHWLDKQDGHFVARTNVGGIDGILATPVVDNDVVYVLTRDGHLAAYTVS